MTNPITLSSATLDVTLSGLINAYGSIGVYEINGTNFTIDAAVFGPSGSHFTVHNTGTIFSDGRTEYDAGIFLGASGTVFNTATIEAGSGIAILGTTGKSSLSNSGEILGSVGVGLVAFDAVSVKNTGFIFGQGYGLELVAGGVVTNAAGGTIGSGDEVAIASKLAGTVTNAGTLRGEYGGIFLQAGGKVTNSGLILQTNSNSAGGALESYQAASVTNSGLIEGGNGIKFEISSPTSAIFVTNSGTIDVISTVAQNSFWFDGFLTYGVGLYSTNAGEVVNSKLIEGNHIGVAFEHAAGTVINTGTISAAVGYGVYLNVGGTLSNTGTIYGNDQGMFIGASAGTVANFISNSGYIGATHAPETFPNGTYFGGGILDIGTATIINSGTVTDPGGEGIQLFGVSDAPELLHSTLINSGFVRGLYGVLMYGAGGVSNTGTIIAKDDGVFLQSPGLAVVNTGTIEATGTTFNYSTIAANTYTAAGLRLKAGGTVTNAATGHIAAPGGDAIHAYADPAIIINDGGITAGKVGIFLSAGGSVQNAGYIQSGTGSGIYNDGTGALTVDNAKTGFIAGAQSGITDNGSAGTLINDGTIIATKTTIITHGVIDYTDGVRLENGGTITNASAGTIIGANGIAIQGDAGGFVNNAGHVKAAGGTGIYLGLAGTVINTGTISATKAGIDLYGGGFVSNAGLIDAGHGGLYLHIGGTAVNTGNIAAGLAGIYAFGAATVTNAGTIRGDTDGIDLAGGDTLIDTGTIQGNDYAISFATGNGNLLVINAASDIIGAVNGGNGILELAADGKTIGSVSTARQAQFANFGSLEIASGALWDFTGNFTIAGPNPLLNDGTIKESKTDTLTIDSALTGTGTVDLSKKVLTLNGGVASGEKIEFSGTGETLALGDPAGFDAKIEKFKLGDTIDLTSISLSAITATHFAAGVLTLDEGDIKLEFTFDNPSTFGSDSFKLSSAGAGTAITLAAAAALLPVTHVTTLAPLATLGS
jgi:hypothetical protein